MEPNLFFGYIRYNKIKTLLLLFALALYFTLVVITWTLSESVPEIAKVPFQGIGVQTIVQKEGKIPEQMIGAVFPHSNGLILSEEMRQLSELEFVQSYDKGLYFWFFDKVSFKSILGIPGESTIFSEILKKNIRQGSYELVDEGVLVTQKYADKNGLGLQSRLEIGPYHFTITGILNPNINGNILPADIYLDFRAAMEIVSNSEQIRKIYAVPDVFYNVGLFKADASWQGDKEALIKKINQKLLIFSEKTFSNEILDQLRLVSSAGRTMMIFLGILLVISFMIMVVFNLKTREKDLAILRMLGWRIADLKKQLISEGFILLAVALLLGVLFSIIGLEILSRQTISMELPWDISARPHFLPEENNIPRLVQSQIPIFLSPFILFSTIGAFVFIFHLINLLIFRRLKKISPVRFME